jgi:hypothetical protein
MKQWLAKRAALAANKLGFRTRFVTRAISH